MMKEEKLEEFVKRVFGNVSWEVVGRKHENNYFCGECCEYLLRIDVIEDCEIYLVVVHLVEYDKWKVSRFEISGDEETLVEIIKLLRPIIEVSVVKEGEEDE